MREVGDVRAEGREQIDGVAVEQQGTAASFGFDAHKIFRLKRQEFVRRANHDASRPQLTSGAKVAVLKRAPRASSRLIC